MFCPECGHEVADDARFCPNCGKNLAVANEDQASNDEAPQDAVPDEAEPATPSPPEPAADDAAPSPATPLTAREAVAQDSAEEPETQEVQGAAQPTPTPSQPTSGEPRASAAPTEPPAPSADATPPSGQPPTGQQPPAGEGAPSAPPPDEKKTNWGSICLIGCGVLLLLGILSGIGIWLFMRWGSAQMENLPDTPANIMDRIEPGEDTDGDASDGETEETGDTATPDGDGGLGDIVGQLGEALEGAGQSVEGLGETISGLDLKDLDAEAMPQDAADTLNAFSAGLALDSEQAMMLAMSEKLEDDFRGTWEKSPNLQHSGFRVVEQERINDTELHFVIEQALRNRETDEQIERGWDLTLRKTNNRWQVDEFSETEI